MAELKTRVDELKMENDYQLRLKDMNYNEKIKELTEKFIQEMESLKTKNQVDMVNLYIFSMLNILSLLSGIANYTDCVCILKYCLTCVVQEKYALSNLIKS